MFDLKKAYLDLKGDKCALITYVSRYGYTIDAETLSTPKGDAKIKETSNFGWIFTDFSNSKIPCLPSGKGKNLEWIIKNTVGYKNASAQKAELLNLNYSNYYTQNLPSPKTNNGATVNPQIVQKKVQKKGVRRAKIHKSNYKLTAWDSQIGRDLLAYFWKKTGCGDIDFLTKIGITPVVAQFCKHQYLAETRGLGLMRKVEPKNPKDTRAYRVGDWSNFPQTSYIFGYELLPTAPKSTDVLIICEGQTDAILGNFHLNAYGFYFITLGSVANSGLLDAETNLFKSLYSQIFVLWDNDDAGAKSKDFADAHGFGWIDAKAFFGDNLKDICEAWDKALNHFLSYPNPKETAQKFLLEGFKECAQKTAQIPQKPTFYDIPAIVGDRFSIGVKGAIKHDFNQYLGEGNSRKIVLDFIQNNKRALIQAPAGSGKSTILFELAKLGERLLIFTPTKAICKQLCEAFKEFIKKEKINNPDFALRVLYVDGQTRINDIKLELEHYSNECIIIGTFDSCTLKKFPTNVRSNYTIVVDEFHQIANDYPYRKKAMNRIADAIRVPNQKTLLLSATPNRFFSSEQSDELNFKSLICDASVKNKIHFRFFTYSKNRGYAISALLKRIEKADIKGTVLVKFDSLKTLYIWKKYLTFAKKKVEVFNSKGGVEYNTANENFNSIMGKNVAFDDPFNPEKTEQFVSGELHTDTDFILTTTLLEAGVSLNFAVPLIVTVDTRAWQRLVQFSTRPRYNAKTGVNASVECWALFPEKHAQNKGANAQMATQIFEEQHLIASDIAKDFNNLLHSGNNPTAIENTLDAKIIPNAVMNGSGVLSSRARKFVYLSNQTQKFEVSVPAILSHIHELETALSDIETIKNRMVDFDNRFQMYPTETLAFDKESYFLVAEFDTAKALAKEQKQAFGDLLKQNAQMVALALTYNNPNPKSKQAFADFAKNTPNVLLTPADTETAKTFIEANKTAFEYDHKHPKARMVLESLLLDTTQNLDILVNDVLLLNPTKTQIEQTRKAHAQIIDQYRTDKINMRVEDRVELEQELKPIHTVLKQLIRDSKKGRDIFKPLSFYIDLYNQHIKQNVKLHSKNIFPLLMIHYGVTEKREGRKQTYLYALDSEPKNELKEFKK